MAFRITFLLMATLIAGSFFAVSQIEVEAKDSIKSGISSFNKVWRGKKSTNIEKLEAIKGLPTGDSALLKTYVDILENDVWQYRWEVAYRIYNEGNTEFLDSLWKWATDSKNSVKNPTAAEHMIWALINNEDFTTLDHWKELGDVIRDKKHPISVKSRVLRELGIPRLADVKEDAEEKDKEDAEAKKESDFQKIRQDIAKQNVRLLIDLLTENLELGKKASMLQRFLIIDGLESLTSEEHGDNVKAWNVWYRETREDGKLKVRTREKFKDEFDDADLEGHSFVRKKARATELELLVLPDLGKTDEYWYPAIFQLNKTFKCTFIQLPDCSRMKNLKYLKDRNGTIDKSGFYYPLEQLVEVFEQRRERFAQKKVGLIAHGTSGWVALEYLRLHPDKIAFAIIINTWSGRKSRESGRNQMAGWKKPKDDAYKNTAEDLVYHPDPDSGRGSLSLNKSQKMWSATGSIRRQGGDIRALEPIFYGIMEKYRVKPDSNQRIFVPDFEFAKKNKRNKIDTPVLFINGAKDPMFWAKDFNVYKKTFTKLQWDVYEDAGCTPWADDPERFFASVDTLMEKYKIVENLKKEAEKERKKREKEEKKNKKKNK